MATTGEAVQETPPPVARLGAEDRRAAWLQFPRRAILLLIAYGLAWGLILGLRGFLPPVFRAGGGARTFAAISERMPASMALLGSALVLIIVQAAIVASIAVAIHRLERRAGIPGSVLKGLGRLWVFSQGATPVFALAVLAILFFALQLKILPAAWGGAAERASLLGRIRFLILPAWCLALLPAMLTAQVVAREITLPREGGGQRVWLGGLLKGLGAVSGQFGGLLSSLVLVETVFAWPGIGRLMIDALFIRLEVGVAVGVIGAFASLVLVGRLAAELFRWLARLRPASPPTWPEVSTPWRQTARRVWVAAALALLVFPIGLALAGLATSPGAAQRVNPAESNEPPSGAHLLGTDELGRDAWALLRRGSFVTVGIAALAAVMAAIPGGLGGALVGWLAARRTPGAESLADLLLLPAEAFLLIPALPFAILLAIVFGLGSWTTLALAVAVVLAPRLAKYVQAIWLAGPGSRQANHFLAGAGSLLLAAWFASAWFVSALDFLGVGMRPPTPTLGGVIAQAMSSIRAARAGVAAAGVALGLCAFALFTAASALAGFFPTKEPLARLNE